MLFYGMPMSFYTWNKAEVDILQNLYSKLPIQEIAVKLGRSIGSVYAKASRLGITREVGHKHRWTKAEVDLLEELYPKTRAEDIAKRLGCSIHSVHYKASRLGIKPIKSYHNLRNWSAVNPYFELTEAERAYIAGIIDGEGCIRHFIEKGRHILVSRIIVANTSFELIDYLHKRLGGNYWERRHKNPNYKRCWLWELNSNVRVQCLLDVLFPYFIVKRQKAEEALKSLTTLCS